MDLTLKNAHDLDDANVLAIQELICNVAAADLDEVSTPTPLIAKMSTADNNSQIWNNCAVI